MRLPLTPPLDTKDGVSAKNARLTNCLKESKKTGDKAVVRPGLVDAATSTGNGYGLVRFNDELVSVYGATLGVGLVQSTTPSIAQDDVGNIPLPVGQYWGSVAHNGSIFCAIGYSQVTNKVAVSSDGITWSNETISATSRSWSRIIWNGTQFLAIAENPTYVSISTDGVNWTEYSSGPYLGSASYAIVGIAWNGSIYCGVSGSIAKTATSSDWITWNIHTTSIPLHDVAWNGSVFCGVRFNSSQAATSSDGISWSTQSLPASKNWNSIAWNGSTFCATCNNNIDCATSSNGVSWSAGSMPFSASWKSLVTDGSQFCVAAYGYPKIATSTDGLVWTEHTITTTALWRAGAWDGASFCFVGYGPETEVITFEFAMTVQTISTVTGTHYDFAQSPI